MGVRMVSKSVLGECLGLSNTELEVVALLVEGPATLKEISLRVGVHYQTVIDTLRKLVARGWVIRINRGTYFIGPGLIKRLVELGCLGRAGVDRRVGGQAAKG